MRTRGEPSRSATRRARSTISRVGPPPPSPYPNGSRERVAGPLSANCRDARASSSPVTCAVRVRGREVHEDAGAVDAGPPEAVVRHAVHLVPGELLGEEPARSRQAGERGGGGGVPQMAGRTTP